MSLKRAYCTKCHNKNDKIRIFEVNPEAAVCYCPHCMAELEPADAIQAYDNRIDKMLKEAQTVLYQQTDYALAYSMFAQIIELDNSNIDARFGRIISLIYMSKLRRTRFLDCELMTKEETTSFFHKASAYEKYAKFLIEVNHATDSYHKLLKKKLTFRNYFYDDECIKLFYKRDNEIGELKRFILEEATWLNAKHESNEMTELVATLDKDIKENEKEASSKFYAVDGYLYGLAGFSNDGTPILGHNSKPQNLKIKRSPKKTLGNSDRKTKVISDDVYRGNMQLYSFSKKVICWIVIHAILAVASIACFFLIKTKPYDLVSLIAAGYFTFCTLLLLLFMLLAKHELKKRYRLIHDGGKKAS